jgi:predicted nucleotidyltransferase
LAVTTLPTPNFETLEYVIESLSHVPLTVIGATALALRGHAPSRRSDDVDLAVAIEPGELASLRTKLRPGGWEQERRMPHHWRHDRLRLRVDVIPAGARPGAVSSYDLGPGLTLDVRGLDVALRSSEVVNVSKEGDPSRTIDVPTPPLVVLVFLKMVAYVDKPHLREKDASDVGRVMEKYLAPDDVRRWEPPLAGIEDEDFKAAGALAEDMAPHLTLEYRKIVDTFMDDPVARGLVGLAFPSRENAGNELARAFAAGLRAGSSSR